MPRPLKLTKLHFIGIFLSITGMLTIVRCVNPNIVTTSMRETSSLNKETPQENLIAQTLEPEATAIEVLEDNTEVPPAAPTQSTVAETTSAPATTSTTPHITIAPSTPPLPRSAIEHHSIRVDSIFLRNRNPLHITDAKGQRLKNRIKGVKSYHHCFKDLNDVQLATAQSLGIPKIEDRQAAAERLSGVVFVGDNPYYGVKELTHSIPYLIPRAAICLEEIARAFMDSCITKGVPMHKIVLTSVLRTEKDVRRLRRINLNASENSCHQYGTTFDISYNHFIPIESPTAPATSSNKLKQILAEVLEDQHQLGTCYIKYEHLRSACFHITAR